MSVQNGSTGRMGGALRGLLYMRIRELTTVGSLVRSALVAVACFGLMMFLNLDPSGASGQFQYIIGTVFALRFLPIYCLAKGGEALRNELKEGTMEYIWVRPANKVEIYLGFYCGALMSVWAIIVPCLIGISIAGVAMGVVGLGELLTLWLTSIAITAAFTAISAALSSVSSKFVVLGIFYYAFMELGLGHIPNGIQRLAVTFHSEGLLSGLTGLSYRTGGLSSYLWILGIAAVMVACGAAVFRASRYIVGSDKDA